MVDASLDTSIIVDLLRGYPNAQNWLSQQQQALGVSLYVWLEVLEGANNKRDQVKSANLLNRFALIEVNQADVQWAVQQLTRFNLSHNMDSLDCLIAAPSVRLNIPLHTRNLKHFSPILGALAVAPYS